MSQFFVVTDQSVLGPFSGIELREAALAGVLSAESVVGSSASGPWYSAVQIGLFSNRKVPLAHPSDVVVPSYHVRGVPGAFQGPFKLRELIGFASRGMLPLDAELASVGSEVKTAQWVPVRRFRLLTACLSGELVLLDPSNRIHLRTKGVLQGADATRWGLGYRAPIAALKPVDEDDVTTRASERSFSLEDVQSDGILVETGSNRGLRSVVNSGPKKTRLGKEQLRIRDVFGHFGNLVSHFAHSRIALAAAILLVVSAATAVGLTLKQSKGMKREALIGDWVADEVGDGQSPFGISFRPDGSCVIFGVAGDSWTGDYVWQTRRDLWSTAVSQQSMRYSVDNKEPHHADGLVDATDGYLVLRGFGKRVARIDGHEVQDLFVRRHGDQLKIGYLTDVVVQDGLKKLSAAWIEVKPLHAHVAADPIDHLKTLRLPSEPDPHEGEPPLPEAIALAQNGEAARGESPFESHARVSEIDCLYLLTQLGMPDEARKAYKFEVPQVSKQDSFPADELIRYGELVLMVAKDGKIHYVRFVKNHAS